LSAVRKTPPLSAGLIIRACSKPPEGERAVSAGDFLYFPNNKSGAHKITNTSESEPLVYADFDILHEPEVVFYPDSGKIGIFGKGNRLIFKESQAVDYFEGG